MLLLIGIETNPGPSHSEFRAKVCAVCYLKSDRSINAEQEQLIKEHVDVNYCSALEGFPTGICTKCKFALQKNAASINRNEKQQELALASKSFRSSNHKSESCYVCKIASGSGLQYRRLTSEIKGKTTKKKGNKSCPSCFTVLYRGCSHPCNKTQKKKNIKAAADEVTKEEIANEVLREKVGQGSKGTKEIKLRSGGRPAIFSVKRGRIQKKSVIRKCTVHQAKVNAGLSSKQTNAFMQVLRTDTGRDGMEAGIRESLVEQNKTFTSFFKTENVLMKTPRVQASKARGDRNDRSDFEKQAVKGKRTEYVDTPIPLSYCINVNDFYKQLLELRGIENEDGIICKIGIDDGRGKLKINLSIIPKTMESGNEDKQRKFLDKFKVMYRKIQ